GSAPPRFAPGRAVRLALRFASRPQPTWVGRRLGPWHSPVRMSDSEIAQRRVGTTLKRKWTLEKVLGVGGMASVYLGRHKIGRLDAIKILHVDIANSPLSRSRFEQE